MGRSVCRLVQLYRASRKNPPDTVRIVQLAPHARNPYIFLRFGLNQSSPVCVQRSHTGPYK